VKIVLAPDSYKGSLTAKQACEAMEKGIRKVLPDAEIVKIPMADGGEGTVQSLVDATSGTFHTVEVTGPLGQKVKAAYGVLGDKETAVLEMAEASGLYLIPAEKRNPLLSTTYGTGELIKSALDEGCRKFIIGIGGSATNDGGMGMAQALGVKFLDKKGKSLPFGGGNLGDLSEINMDDMDPRIQESQFFIACDVDNPLCGPQGASFIFGPQKGATPGMVQQLDDGLAHFAEIIARDIGKFVADLPGAGAAGGLGAGLVAFLDANLKRGIEIVTETVKLREQLQGVDLLFTGEGQCDGQTVRGKTPFGVAKIAKQAGVPVVFIVGRIGAGSEILYEYGIKSIFSMVDGPMTVEEAMSQAYDLLTKSAERIMRITI
jgi:glycerate 2-kinase